MSDENKKTDILDHAHRGQLWKEFLQHQIENDHMKFKGWERLAADIFVDWLRDEKLNKQPNLHEPRLVEVKEFIEKVKQMRDKQREYFKTRSRVVMIESINMEGEVDKMLCRLAQ